MFANNNIDEVMWQFFVVYAFFSFILSSAIRCRLYMSGTIMIFGFWSIQGCLEFHLLKSGYKWQKEHIDFKYILLFLAVASIDNVCMCFNYMKIIKFTFLYISNTCKHFYTY